MDIIGVIGGFILAWDHFGMELCTKGYNQVVITKRPAFVRTWFSWGRISATSA